MAVIFSSNKASKQANKNAKKQITIGRIIIVLTAIVIIVAVVAIVF